MFVAIKKQNVKKEKIANKKAANLVERKMNQAMVMAADLFK